MFDKKKILPLRFLRLTPSAKKPKVFPSFRLRRIGLRYAPLQKSTIFVAIQKSGVLSKKRRFFDNLRFLTRFLSAPIFNLLWRLKKGVQEALQKSEIFVRSASATFLTKSKMYAAVKNVAVKKKTKKLKKTKTLSKSRNLVFLNKLYKKH